MSCKAICSTALDKDILFTTLRVNPNELELSLVNMYVFLYMPFTGVVHMTFINVKYSARTLK